MENTIFNKKPPKARIEELDEIIRDGYSPALHMWRRVKSFIESFEQNLDKDHEAVVNLVTASASIASEVLSISYWSPDMLIFECRATDEHERLVLQHYSQLNFCISSCKRKDPSRPARRIGFTAEPPEHETDCHSQSRE